jgi:exodeoxyribonuclease VII large subunit
MDELIIFSVFEITQHLKQVIETQIEPLYVRGEISNYTRHSSGHIYFNLKDANATLRCTFFRFANMHLDFEPEEGMEVVCFGQLTVYEKGGSYNLNVQSMERSGKGDLARQFELLKQKLHDEGLFAPEQKKPLPRYPQRLGIVTSPTGAALQDILNILKRRFPVEIDVFPALVQGKDAPPELIAGIEYFNATAQVDLIILTRGGGSQEDLFCFNDEALARAVFASKIPIISAVGHEIDFTIADFVADLRAPTPSAAAELAVPDKKDIQTYLSAMKDRIKLAVSARLEISRGRFGNIQYKLSRFHPEKAWQNMQLRLDMATLDLVRFGGKLSSGMHNWELRQTVAMNSIRSALGDTILHKRARLGELRIHLISSVAAAHLENRNRMEKLGLRLESLSPQATLERGYSMVQRGTAVLKSVHELGVGDDVSLRMKDGTADMKVRKVTPQ